MSTIINNSISLSTTIRDTNGPNVYNILLESSKCSGVIDIVIEDSGKVAAKMSLDKASFSELVSHFNIIMSTIEN